ncbi:MAG: hypothetical protein ACQETE_01810 [Bacteroidota bacterium]
MNQKRFYLLLGFTFVVRALFELIVVQINPDNSFQLSIAYNILQGNGIYFSSLNLSDLSQITYEAIAGWPYFYPFLITLGGVFIENLLTVAIIVDMATVVFLVYAVYTLAQNLNCNTTTSAIFILYTLFHSEIFFRITSTGLLSLTLLIFSVSYLAGINWQKITTKKIIIVTLLGCLPAIFRFAYFPVAMAIPLALGTLFLVTKNRISLKQIVLSFIIASASVAALFLFHKLITGYVTYLFDEQYVDSSTLSFYPSNLKYFYPFISEGILPRKLLRTVLDFLGAQQFSNYILLIITLGIVGFVARQIIPKIREHELSKQLVFVVITFWVVAIVTSMLATMSLIEPLHRHFTPVQGYRYHAPSIFLIGLAFLYVLMNTNWAHKGKLAGTILVIIFLSNGTINYKLPYWSHPWNPKGESIFRHKDIIKESGAENPRYTFYLYNNSYLNIYGIPTLFEYHELVQTDQLNSSQPITFFMGMPKEKRSAERIFLEKNPPDQHYDLPYTDLYRFDIQPRTLSD